MSNMDKTTEVANEENLNIKVTPEEISQSDLKRDLLIGKVRKKIPERLDSLPFSGFHLWVICSLGVSWVLDGYEVSLLSVLSGYLKTIFTMDESELGLAGSIYLLGCVMGSLFFGYLAGKLGRKFLFTITLGIYVMSILFTAISINKYMFIACRFLTGIAVGGEYSAIFAAIDELIPPINRGRADLIIDGTWHLGSTFSSLLSYLTLSNFPEYQDMIIRLLFIIGVILAFPVIYMRKFIPESPRWLLYRGRYKEALTTVEKIEANCKSKSYNYKNENYCSGSDSESANLLSELDNFKQLENEKLEEISFKEIFYTLLYKHRTRFMYSLILMASQAFFYNGIFYTYTLVLLNFYHIEKAKAGLYLIPLSLASFLGPIALGGFFDTWSRRKMIGLTFITAGLMLIISALNFVTNKFDFTIQQMLWFVTFFIASPAASSAHLTVSEIFPIEMRSQAMAIFFSCGLGIGGVIAPFLFGLIVKQDNKGTIFFSYLLASFIMIMAGIFGLCFGVDAEKKSLEEISKNIRDKDDDQEEQKTTE